MEIARPAPTGRIFRLLFPLGTVTALVGFGSALTSPFLSVFLSKNLGADPIHSSIFLFLGPLAGVVVATMLGYLSDRRTMRRQLLIIASLAGAVANVVFALIPQYWVLLAVSMTFLAVSGALVPQSYAHARHVLDREGSARVPMAMSVLRTLFSLAWVLGPSLAGILVDTLGFPGLYGLAAVTFVVSALIVLVWLDKDHPESADSGSDQPTHELIDRVSESEKPSGGMTPSMWLISAGFLVTQCAASLAILILPLFVSENLHGGLDDAGRILGLCAALEIPLIVIFGALASRIETRILVLAGIVMAIGYYVTVIFVHSVWQLAAAQILNACFISTVLGLGITYFQDLMPAFPGQATTLFTNTNRLAAMVAGPIFGVAQLVGYRLAFGICAALCVLGLLILTLASPGRLSGR